jgi:hypothetical protein
MKHVLSPKGWAVFVVNEVEPDPKAEGWVKAGLMPSPVLVPPARLADVAGLCAEEKIGVTSVALGYTKKEPKNWFELALGWKRYWVRLVPDWGASAPLSASAHRLYILCPERTCDLSPLFALADPLTWPKYAARIARAYVATDNVNRWIPICDKVDCGRLPSDIFGGNVMDILSSPKKLYYLFKLVYDRSPETRAVGYRLGLWTVDPRRIPDPSDMAPRGEFTLAASMALSYATHMIPFEEVKRYIRLRAVKTL